jgi:hypothetical protein
MFDVPLHSKDKVQQRANGLRRIALIIHKTRIQLRYELVTILHPLRFKVKKPVLLFRCFKCGSY